MYLMAMAPTKMPTASPNKNQPRIRAKLYALVCNRDPITRNQSISSEMMMKPETKTQKHQCQTRARILVAASGVVVGLRLDFQPSDRKPIARNSAPAPTDKL